MAVYAIGDLHLSLTGDKAMDSFPGWENYVSRIEENWLKIIRPEDTVVLVGDISWGMSLEESLEDFRFIDRLPGRKILLKGNHDYWWTTRSKIERFWQEHGLNSLVMLHNNSIVAENLVICGSRGWIFDDSEPADAKVMAREVGRLQASIGYPQPPALEKVVFLHYPPIYGEARALQILDILQQYQIQRCFYGHLHGPSGQYAFQGAFQGTQFRLVSADFIKFAPIKLD